MPAASRRKPPSVIILAGPNGAGKTTAAPALLEGTLEVTEFVNADAIAQGLSGFEPEGVAIAAGRIMLTHLKELARRRVSFAFETTLASRSFAPWIADLIKRGYEFHLVFLWLPDADAAVARIAERVRMGGHGVPEETVRRRYNRGLRNFFGLYRPLAATWRIYDTSSVAPPRLVVVGKRSVVTKVTDQRAWHRIRKGAGYED